MKRKEKKDETKLRNNNKQSQWGEKSCFGSVNTATDLVLLLCEKGIEYKFILLLLFVTVSVWHGFPSIIPIFNFKGGKKNAITIIFISRMRVGGKGGVGLIHHARLEKKRSGNIGFGWNWLDKIDPIEPYDPSKGLFYFCSDTIDGLIVERRIRVRFRLPCSISSFVPLHKRS